MNLRVVTDPECELLMQRLKKALASKLLLAFVRSLPEDIGITVFLHVRAPGAKHVANAVAWSSMTVGSDTYAQHTALLDACDMIQKGTFK